MDERAGEVIVAVIAATPNAAIPSWVHHSFPLPRTISYQMKHFFGRKRNKTPKSPQQPISPGKSRNIVAGSPGSGSRVDQHDANSGTHKGCCCVVDLPSLIAETDNGSTGASSQIALQEGPSEFRVSNLGIDGTGSRYELASKCFSSLRSRPILVQLSGSLQNRRARRYWSWRARLSRTIETYVSL